MSRSTVARSSRPRSRVAARRNQYIASPLVGFEDSEHGAREPLPVLTLEVELLAPDASQLVEPGAEVVVRHAPFRRDPSLALDPVEGRVERALLDAQNVGRHLPDARADPVAV